MSQLPRIYVVGDQRVEEGYRYQIFVGRKNNEIVYLALSRYGVFTISMLLLKVDAEFTESTVFADVYRYPEFPKEGPYVKFWSQTHAHCYKEDPFDPFMNNETRQDWEDILGFSVTFYPYGGPADKPEKFPEFPKKSETPDPIPPSSSRPPTPPQPVKKDDGMIPF